MIIDRLVGWLVANQYTKNPIRDKKPIREEEKAIKIYSGLSLIFWYDCLSTKCGPFSGTKQYRTKDQIKKMNAKKCLNQNHFKFLKHFMMNHH